MAEAGGRAEAEESRIDIAIRDRFKVIIPGICKNCSRAHIWRTGRMNEPVVRCRESGLRVPTDVVEGNEFKQVGVLSVWELAQMCLDIDISKSTKRVGFGKDSE